MTQQRKNIKFKLPFHSMNEIKEYAKRFCYPKPDPNMEKARDRGYLTIEELKAVCEWKTERNKKLLVKNNDVENITKCALKNSDEKQCMKILLQLQGVGRPRASAILHFCHKTGYPILDQRAWWSITGEKPKSFSLARWSAYTVFCRDQAERFSVSMRTLDKALWQYSKEQSSGKCNKDLK